METDSTETSIGADYDCSSSTYTTLGTKLIGFHVRTSYAYLFDPHDSITSLALILDTENCELAKFSPDPSSNPVTDMSAEVNAGSTT